MEKVSEFIVKQRKWILACFVVLVIASGIASTFVNVNHDMVQYLPNSSSVKQGVNLMSGEFEESTSISVMFADLGSDEEMQQVADELADIKDVSSVTFDAQSDSNVKDGYALYTVNIDGNAYDSKAQTILKQIQKEYADHEMYVAGSVVDQAESAKGLSMLFTVALSILLVILFIMCHSWLEPFIFLIPIGMAVMINSGTNIMFSSISSMTSSVASILQLALSMDYSFMVMERYRQEQKLSESKEIAMQKALAHGFVSISSSSVTTIVGMLCLAFMSFTIGKDMGFVLAKGVLISLICIFCVLPALILMFDKVLMKTKKKVPVFRMNKIAAFSYKFRYGILALFLLLLAGSFVIQGKAGITYAVESSNAGKEKIESVFPSKTSLVVLYPNEEEDKISGLIPTLEGLDYVDAVSGYGNTLGKTFTAEEMAEQAGMGQSLVELIYYDFFTGGETGTISVADFVDFIQKDVMTDSQFADYFDEDMKNQLDSMAAYTDPAEVTQERSAAEMADLTGMDAEQMKMMYLLYFSQQDDIAVGSMTIPEFVSFLQNNVLTQDTYASMLGDDVKNQISILAAFTDQDQIMQEKSAGELASLLGMDETSIQQIMMLFYSKNSGADAGSMTLPEFVSFIRNDVINDPQFAAYFDADTQAQINMLARYTDADAMQQTQSISGISDTFGIDQATVKQLMMLYYSQNGGISAGTMTLPEFVSFIQSDVLTNPQFSGSFDDAAKSQIQMLATFTNREQVLTAVDAATLSSMTGMDVNTVGQLLCMYYQVPQLTEQTKMSVYDFVTFLLGSVVTNENYAPMFDQITIVQLNTVKNVMDLSISGTAFDSDQMAGVLGMDAGQIRTLYYYNIAQNQDTSDWQISAKEFLDFIVNDLSQNATYSGMFDATTMSSMKLAQQLINTSIAQSALSPQDMASLIGMDSSLLTQLYYYRSVSIGDTSNWTISEYDLVGFLIQDLANDPQFSGMLDSSTLTQLTLLQKLMNATIAQTVYSYESLSDLIGMDADSLKMLYLLRSLEQDNPEKWKLSLQEMLHYLLDDMADNEAYADALKDMDLSELKVAQKIVDAVADNRELSAAELSELLTDVSDDLDSDTVELLYMLYASQQYDQEHPQTVQKVSMDQLFDFLVNDVLKDDRFAQFFDEETTDQLVSARDTLKKGKKSLVGENYSRLIVTTPYGGESDEVYTLIDQMKEKLDGVGAQYYIIGDSAMSKELSGSFAQELLFITLLTAVAIFIVVAIAFRSISIPVILVAVIQCAIFTAMSVAYFQGISTYFICLLIVQAILMGASIDYAILYTSYYKVERMDHSIRESIAAAYNGAISTILTSASILVIVTFAISKVFSDPTTSQVCATISKGALIATILVIFVLPSLLAVFDKFVVGKQIKKQ